MHLGSLNFHSIHAGLRVNINYFVVMYIVIHKLYVQAKLQCVKDTGA